MVNLQTRHTTSEDKRHSATLVQVNDSRQSGPQVRKVPVAAVGLFSDDMVRYMN